MEEQQKRAVEEQHKRAVEEQQKRVEEQHERAVVATKRALNATYLMMSTQGMVAGTSFLCCVFYKRLSGELLPGLVLAFLVSTWFLCEAVGHLPKLYRDRRWLKENPPS